jgi:hypothetical protein
VIYQPLYRPKQIRAGVYAVGRKLVWKGLNEYMVHQQVQDTNIYYFCYNKTVNPQKKTRQHNQRNIQQRNTTIINEIIPPRYYYYYY